MIGFNDAPRYSRAIQRLTGDEDIVPPGLTLEDDRIEWGFLKREFLFTTGPAFVAANAGGVSQVQLEFVLATRTGPRRIATITGIKVCGVNVVAGDRYSLTHNAANAATPAQSFGRDTRWDAGPALFSRGQLRTLILNTNPSVSGDILDEVSASATGQDLLFHIVPVILHQGVVGLSSERYTVFSNAVNKALRVIAWGYERIGRPEEFDVDT